MADTYRTFTRSATNWKQFFRRGGKRVDSTGLGYEDAKLRCEWYNSQRTPKQISRGTMMEFEKE